MSVAPEDDRGRACSEIGVGGAQLTVVIPHYNHIDLLPAAVASVIDQDFAGLEIVIVDDGSDSAVQPKLDRLERAAECVRIVRHPTNRGAPAALNTGLAAARGAFVSFLGADDLALPGLYATMVDALERNPSAPLACGEIAIAGDDGDVRGIRPMMAPAFQSRFLDPDAVRRLSRDSDNWVCNTATVYRTAMLRSVGGFDESLGALCDGYLVRLLAFQHGFAFAPGIVGVWRVAPQTLSATSLLEIAESDRMRRRGYDLIAGSAIDRLAPGYAETFSRRLRFSAARTHFLWTGADAEPETICRAAALGPADRRALGAIKTVVGFGAAGRALAIGWLAARLRPFGFAKLLVHFARNRFLLMRYRGRIRTEISRSKTRAERLTIERNAA